MRHCCEFDAFDIWYLKDNEEYTNRTMFIGDCPICNKHVVHLYQRNNKTNTIIFIKKIGETAYQITKDLYKEIVYSRNALNKMKFNPKPFGWRYGVNKIKSDKNGNKVVEQYAVDFFGNSELIKKNKIL